MNWRTLLGTLILISSWSVQSCKDDEPIKWVDLRYKAADSYTIAASGKETVSIQVKSTDPWIVYSNHSDWCTISPNQGEANELYDVQITYTPNTSLDDRTDTVTIKSDYWIGKEVSIIQKGIAYLTLENADDLLLEKEETTYSFNVKSNQNWSAAVTEGDEWLSIQSGENGTLDGMVTLKALENKGEQRSGIVVIYDRHGKEVANVECTQKGVVLTPTTQSLRALYNDATVTLHVESNGEWIVEKENEEDEWYSFTKTEYNGTDDIVINLQENTGLSVLKATFRISSKAQAGSEPIVKVIALKQGNKVEAERHSFVDNEWTITAGKPVFADGAVNFAYKGTNCRISREGMKPGSYKFHISASSNDAQCQLYFLYGEKEIRWMLFKGEGENARCGTSDGGVIQYPFNNKKSEYTVEMNILEGAPSGSMKLEWHLDGALLRSIPSYTGVAYGTNAQIILGVAKGTATYDWWEYTAPIEWGDE